MEINLQGKTPDVRKLRDMEKAVMDKEWLANAQNPELYYMYRGISENNGVRYDITVVPALMLGKEFVKTKGHYHIGNYPEIYTVLEGQALYLMQKKVTDEEIEDVYAVKASKGDVVIIPPNYGHITINPSATQQLTMANWVASACKSDYAPFEKLVGGSWLYTTEGWVKNTNYKNVPELRFEEPVKEVPKNLEFLTIA